MLNARFCTAFCLSAVIWLLSGVDCDAGASGDSDPLESLHSSATLSDAEISDTTQHAEPILDLPLLPKLDDNRDVDRNQQASMATLKKNNAASDTIKEDTFVVYGYLNYVTMSCTSALEDPDLFPADLITTACFQVSDEARQIPVEPASNEIVIRDQEDLTQPVSSGLTRKPLSSIRLVDSILQKDETGHPLATPEESDGHQSATVSAEHHFVPAPWHRPHPSRNTYPIRYQPLYFEDPNMERCGETGGCLTEVKSIAHFAGRIPLLPYMMASNSPHKCVRALPDCPTCQQFGPDAYLPKPTVKAIAVQAAATVGAIYVIP